MTGLNEATEDDHETPQDWKENSWDIKNNRPASNDKDAITMKSKQEGLTKRINKFMIGEQAEEERNFYLQPKRPTISGRRKMLQKELMQSQDQCI